MIAIFVWTLKDVIGLVGLFLVLCLVAGIKLEEWWKKRKHERDEVKRNKTKP